MTMCLPLPASTGSRRAHDTVLLKILHLYELPFLQRASSRNRNISEDYSFPTLRQARGYCPTDTTDQRPGGICARNHTAQPPEISNRKVISDSTKYSHFSIANNRSTDMISHRVISTSRKTRGIASWPIPNRLRTDSSHSNGKKHFGIKIQNVKHMLFYRKYLATANRQ